MAAIRDVDAVVLDVLGTLVDEPSGLRAAIREAVPESDEASADELLALWQRHGERERRRIAPGNRGTPNSSNLYGNFSPSSGRTPCAPKSNGG